MQDNNNWVWDNYAKDQIEVCNYLKKFYKGGREKIQRIMRMKSSAKLIDLVVVIPQPF